MEIITNISSDTNLKYDEYWEISEKKIVKNLPKIRKFGFQISEEATWSLQL